MESTINCPRCQSPQKPGAARCEQCDEPLAVGRGGVGGFLAENWAWILAPIVIAALILVIVLVFLGDESSPFVYNIW